MKRLLVAGAFLSLPCCALAQSGLRGQVIDARSTRALRGASVYLPDHRDGTTTAADGSFLLEAAAPGDSLTISCTGYRTLRVAAGAGPLRIALQPSTTPLNDLVVTASREAEPRAGAAVAIGTLSGAVLRETHASSLDQVMNKVAGVYMVDLGNEQHTMAIRQPIGYRSTFLYLEDGVPIRATGDFNHNALIEINAAALERIEVIRGPSSSLYGADAVGGAVNFITRAPAARPEARLQLQGSGRGYRRADLLASGRAGKSGGLLAGYYARQSGLEAEHGDFHKLALTGRVERRLGTRAALTGVLTRVAYRSDQTGGLDSAHFFGRDLRSPYRFSWRKVEALRGRLSWTMSWSDRQHSAATVYYRDDRVGQNPFYAIRDSPGTGRAEGEINEDAFRSGGLLLQHSVRFPFWAARWISGLSADYSSLRYQARYIRVHRNERGDYTAFSETDSLLSNYRVQLLELAAYTQAELSPWPRLKLIAALRADRLAYAFDNRLPPSAYSGAPDDSNRFRQLTPKLGLSYRLGGQAVLYANYSVGFAPPDVTDLYTGVKVPYLRPARYRNYEAGGRLTFGQASGALNLYHMDGRDEIISVRLDDGTRINANAGRTLHYGVEYTVDYAPLPTLALHVSGTLARHRYRDYVENGQDYSGHEMSGAPHLIMQAEAVYRPAFLPGARAALEWMHLAGYYMDGANTLRYPGYDLLNLRLGYQWKRLEVFVHLLNAGDARYATTAEKTAYSINYRPGPPRTLAAGLAYTFSGREAGQKDKP